MKRKAVLGACGKYGWESLTVAGASLLYALGLGLFLIPSAVTMGGVSGIATVLNILFTLPVGVMILAMNLPLAVLGIRAFGWRFMIKTMVGTAATSVATDLVMLLPISPPTTDPLLCAIFGGAMIGVGCGLLFARGYTTGGSDLAAWLIRKKLPMVPVERVIWVLDMAVVVAAAIVYRSLTSLVYSAVTVFACSKAISYILAGSDEARMAFVVAEQWQRIATRVHDEMGRGVSVADVTGWHTGEPKKLLLCAVKPKELYQLKKLVQECDPKAFTVMCDAAEIMGEGFDAPV